MAARMRALVLEFDVGADAVETPLLGHAEQLGLQRRGHVGDFIQEDGAVVGHLEAANPLRHRAGEGAFLVPEELAFEQGLRDGGAVDLDQRAGRARAPGVDDIGQHFLAHAAFAGDQDAALGGGNQRRVVEDGLHERALGHDVRGQLLVRAELQGRGLGDAGGLLDGEPAARPDQSAWPGN